MKDRHDGVADCFYNRAIVFGYRFFYYVEMAHHPPERSRVAYFPIELSRMP